MARYRARVQTIWQAVGILIENQYFFAEPDVDPNPATATLIATHVDTVILPAQADLQCSKILYSNIQVQDLDITYEVNLVPTLGGGALPVEPLPAWVAVGFILRVEDKRTKPGSKRIAAIPEAEVDANMEITGAVYLASMVAYGVAVALDVNPDIVPIVYGGPTPSDPLRSAANLISSVDYTRVTSQNSRKE